MEKKGVVEKVNEKEIWIRFGRSESCGSCHSCGESDTVEQFNITPADNFTIGDRVTVEMDDGEVLKNGFIVYILPVILLFGGYFCGVLLGITEILRVFLSFAGLILGFVIIFIINKLNGEKISEQIRIKKH